MKKLFLALILFLLLLSGCQSDPEPEYSFIGEVTEVYDGSYILEVKQGWIESSGDLVSISSEDSYSIGDFLEVDHGPEVMESYPLQVNVNQINTVEYQGVITLIDGEDAEIMVGEMNVSVEVENSDKFKVDQSVYVVKRDNKYYFVENTAE